MFVINDDHDNDNYNNDNNDKTNDNVPDNYNNNDNGDYINKNSDSEVALLLPSIAITPPSPSTSPS